MPEMKDSGIEWIGQIPPKWQVSKIKYHLRRNELRNLGDLQILSVYREYGVIPKDSRDDNHNVTSEDTSKYKYVRPGMLVINKMKAWQGSMGISEYEGVVSPAYFVYEFTDKLLDGKYIHYLLRNSYKDEFRRISGGIREGQWDLSAEGFANEFIPIPPIDEQQKIANFLDEKCAEIDLLIDDIQSEIALLEEYKKSVITEAVTKGLDPDAAMKDSGIEWVGQIPSKWQVSKIKYHLRRNELRNLGDLQILSVYREYGVIPKDSRDDNHNVTSADTSKYKYVRPGMLVINKMKAWQGSMGISEYEGAVSPAYFVYEFTDKLLDGKYIHYLLRNSYKDEFRRISGGIREGQWDLPAEGFANEFIPIPPIDEQKIIANYLDEKIENIDECIEQKKIQEDILTEYKKSMIYEYVTGKKEVR